MVNILGSFSKYMEITWRVESDFFEHSRVGSKKVTRGQKKPDSNEFYNMRV